MNSGNDAARINQVYTSSPVSTGNGIGDRLRASKTPAKAATRANQLPAFSRTGDEYLKLCEPLLSNRLKI